MPLQIHPVADDYANASPSSGAGGQLFFEAAGKMQVLWLTRCLLPL